MKISLLALFLPSLVFAASPSEQIDTLIQSGYEEHGVEPNEAAPDWVMVRRIYLDIAGRIPTRAEAATYIHSKDPEKHEKLVQQLLGSDGYVNHWFNFWADILRVNRTANNGQFITPYYSEFIKEFLRENRPYDEFVSDLLTTDGAAWDSGAIGYYLRDRGMPLDNMSNTIRVFLGTRLECAQCHDHPFDSWTQMDYYQMAAFSYDMQSNYRPPILRDVQQYIRGNQRVRGMERGQQRQLAAYRQVFQEVMRPLRYTSIQELDQELRLPDDYQYDNAAPKQVVEAKTMFGSDASPTLDDYADWMTSKDNPRFAKVIANRLWKEVFGIGLIEPVDELLDSTEASNSELMELLESQIKELDYDLKAFLNLLYNTEVYRRKASRAEVLPGESYYFSGPTLRRMSAEQIWDSFVTLINPEPDKRPEMAVAAEQKRLETAHKIHESIYALEPEEFIEGVKAVGDTAGAGAQRSRELAAEAAQARADKDEAKARQLAREANQYRGDVRSKVREHIYEAGWEKLVESGEAAEVFGEEAAAGPMVGAMEARMMGMSQNRGAAAGATRAFQRAQRERLLEIAKNLGITEKEEIRGFAEFLVKMATQAQRAANLPSPAPPGHFLREFGQSDRDVIENANDEASLPQALQLLNGPYAEALVNKYGVLARQVMNEDEPDGKLNVIYLSLYSRYPTKVEREYMSPIIAEFGDEAYKDLVYAILNTQQFLFIQ
ncbi:MAG: hypothetical protein ACI8UO_000593 [Verrucomicrobiales bacterium]|jgi:hypothetical protein